MNFLRHLSLGKIMRLTLICLIFALVSCSKEPLSNPQANSPVIQSSPTVASVQAVSGVLPDQNAHLVRDQVSAEGRRLFVDLYGGVIWKDQSIKKFFNDATEAHITPKFEVRFTENGKDKLFVLGYVAPTEEYICHACVPLLGGAIFRYDNSAWIVESKQTIIGWGDVLETGEFQLVKIGPDRYGLSVHITDAHQGYEDNRYLVIVPYKGKLLIALDSGFIEKPGSAAYIEDDVELAEQNVSINFAQGNNLEYFDVVLKLNYNEAAGKEWHLKSETQHYTFKDGQYINLKQAAINDSLAPLSASNVASAVSSSTHAIQ